MHSSMVHRVLCIYIHTHLHGLSDGLRGTAHIVRNVTMSTSDRGARILVVFWGEQRNFGWRRGGSTRRTPSHREVVHRSAGAILVRVYVKVRSMWYMDNLVFISKRKYFIAVRYTAVGLIGTYRSRLIGD